MDKKLTQSVQELLNQAPAHRDILKGAEMLLKLNHNRILYQNALRRPERMHDKIEYELKKHLVIRLDDMTTSEVREMDNKLVPSVDALLSANSVMIDVENDKPQEATIAKGRRDDHDKLPPEIQVLFDAAGPLYFKIKLVFEELKTMERALPCDRYELLKQLNELETTYRTKLQAYDAYVVGTPIVDVKAETTDPAEVAKKVNAARKYLSDNKTKLISLKEAVDEKKYATLLTKVQERYDYLISTGNNVDEAQVAALVELGLKK